MRAEYLGAFERHLVASAARPQTIATYLRIARAFLELLGDRAPENAERADVEGFLARDRRTGSPAATSTRNLELVALRILFRSQRAADPTAGLALKRPDHRQPDVPTTSELGALFTAASQEPARERALAVLALLFQAGLRVHELVALDVEQVDIEAATLLGVAGKNATRFEVPLGPEAVALLGPWLERHPTSSGPLFPGPTASTPRASVRSIQRLFERLRVAAGLTKRVTPHSLRHATATEAIGRGVSLPDTAALMRHARIETTMIYVAIASNARRVAATRIGAAIPRSILPRGDATTKPSTEGGHDAVDAEHELCDAPEARTGDQTSRKTASLNAPPTRARSFDPEPSGVEPPLAKGGRYEIEPQLERLLADHLSSVRELLGQTLDVRAGDHRAGRCARVRRWHHRRGLRTRHGQR